MARIKLHHDIFQHKSGETIDVDADKAAWAVAEGYASTAKDADGVHATSVPAKQDPRLPENADDEPNTDLREQIADGLMISDKTEADGDFAPTLAHPEEYHVPELTNGKGNVEKADDGKEALEDKAVADSEKTEPVEETGTPAAVEKANDATEKAAQKVEATKAKKAASASA